MNGDEFFALLVVLVIVAGIVLMRRQASAGRVTDADQLRDEVRQLRDRIQVLERIVTDNPALDLDARIERLRDR